MTHDETVRKILSGRTVAEYKPIIAQKPNDGEKINSGDVYYRYRARSEKIKFAEMSRAVFRDSSFANSSAKINVFEIFKLYMPEDADDISKRVRVI